MRKEKRKEEARIDNEGSNVSDRREKKEGNEAEEHEGRLEENEAQVKARRKQINAGPNMKENG